MSHFAVLVIGDNVDEQLAPFDENLEIEEVKDGEDSYFHNPDAQWDWYSIGGRWSGYFKIKPGATGEIGEPGVFENKAEPGYVDSLKLCDIDFEYMSQKSMNKAKERWILVHNVIDSLPKSLPWKHFLDLVESKSITIDEAREQYGNQERVKTFRQKPISDHTGWDSVPEDYDKSLEEYMEDHRYAATTPYAIIHKGSWIARGDMGWWGLSNDKYSGPDWEKKVKSLIDSLLDESPDIMITAVDCHI